MHYKLFIIKIINSKKLGIPMLKDYQIIDADCHVLEPIELWENI
ncbi:hypothetical protein BGP_1173 [Beggiatoa sp. PS]|nr:hypothetical protein BGP_1173 [Beggiatoa sp. PS]